MTRTAALTVRQLFEQLRERLQLEWIAGHEGGDRALQADPERRARHPLVGYLNLVRRNQIQLLGAVELQHLDSLDAQRLETVLEELFQPPTAVLLVSGQLQVPQTLATLASRSGLALWHTPRPAAQVITELRYFVSEALAPRTTLHGVFMEVMGLGVLLTGASNIGKSELALELISRGHALVADDAPEFVRLAPDIVQGRCPPVLRDFLEVRGLGILNIRAMFGDSAVKPSKRLRLIVDLKPMAESEIEALDRLHGSRQSCQVLDVPVPQLTLPVAPGRNLAVLVESAARNHSLRLKGYDGATDFVARQQRLMGS